MIKSATNIGKALEWVWRSVVFGVTAYAVFWLNRSGWWFLFAMLITGMITYNNDRGRK